MNMRMPVCMCVACVACVCRVVLLCHCVSETPRLQWQSVLQFLHTHPFVPSSFIRLYVLECSVPVSILLSVYNYMYFSRTFSLLLTLSLSRLFSVYHLPNFKSHKQKQKKLYDCFFTNEIKVKCGSCCSACIQRTLAQKEPYTLVHQICILYFCVIQMIVFRFFCQSKTFNRRYW